MKGLLMDNGPVGVAHPMMSLISVIPRVQPTPTRMPHQSALCTVLVVYIMRQENH